MSINLELYKVFYYTATEKSFSRAAEQLFISQPAVSQSINKLEEELGGALFIRTPRGVRLTREGEVLYQYIEQAYKLIMTGEKKIAEMHNLLAGEVRIGASDTLSKYYLIPYLEAFHESYPEIQIKVANGTTPEILKLLKSGNVDLGIISLPVDDDQLVIKKGLRIQECFVAGRKYRELAQREIGLEELARYPLMLLEKGTNTRDFVDLYATEHGVVLNPDIELGSVDLLIEFAKIGLGISFVIKDFILEELALGELHEIRVQEEIPERSVGIVTSKNLPLSKAGEMFIRQFELNKSNICATMKVRL